MADTHNDQNDSGKDGCRSEAVGAAFGDNTGYDGCKCSGRPGDLYCTTPECRDNESGYDCGEDSGFRPHTGSKCKCDRKRKRNNSHNNTSCYILDEL